MDRSSEALSDPRVAESVSHVDPEKVRATRAWDQLTEAQKADPKKSEELIDYIFKRKPEPSWVTELADKPVIRVAINDAEGIAKAMSEVSQTGGVVQLESNGARAANIVVPQGATAEQATQLLAEATRGLEAAAAAGERTALPRSGNLPLLCLKQAN